MTKRINLLLKRKDYIRKELIFNRLRLTTYMLGLLTLLILIGLYFINSRTDGEYVRLLSAKEFILKQLIDKKNEEKKLITFVEKSDFYNKTVKSDINFQSYYYRIQESLLPAVSGDASSSASIVNISLDNKRLFKSVIRVNTDTALLELLRHVEDSKLQNTFEDLALESFSIKINPTYYEIVLTGIIKESEKKI